MSLYCKYAKLIVSLICVYKLKMILKMKQIEYCIMSPNLDRTLPYSMIFFQLQYVTMLYPDTASGGGTLKGGGQLTPMNF